MEVPTSNSCADNSCLKIQSYFLTIPGSKQVFPELDIFIFTLLNRNDYTTTLLVSRGWKCITFAAVKFLNEDKVNKFFNFLFSPPKIDYCEMTLSQSSAMQYILFNDCKVIKDFDFKIVSEKIFKTLSKTEQVQVFDATLDSFVKTLKLISEEKKYVINDDIETVINKNNEIDLKREYLNEVVNLDVNLIPKDFYFDNLEAKCLPKSRIFPLLKILTCFNQIETALYMTHLLPEKKYCKSNACKFICTYLERSYEKMHLELFLKYLNSAKDSNKLDNFTDWMISYVQANCLMPNDDFENFVKLTNFYIKDESAHSALRCFCRDMKKLNKAMVALDLLKFIKNDELRNTAIQYLKNDA